ncbi:MAG TPA: metal ABC transporter ATP-binding protein [Terrimicrobiaceae bacterium]
MNGRLLIEDLTVSYHRIPAVHHLTIQLTRGSCTGLLGPNGAGKTTLLKALAGLLPIETGSIRFNGTPITDARLIIYVPQREAVDWDFPITVRGLAEMGRYSALGMWKAFGARDHAIVHEALRMAQLEAFAERQIKALSGGQQHRAFLARAWAQEAEIYLLDEPFGGLDKNASAAFAQAIHWLRDSGKFVIVSHHNLVDASELFDHVLILNGELVAFGETKKTLTTENIDRAFSTGIFTGHK